MITSMAASLGGTALQSSGGISPTLLIGIVVVAIVVVAITWVLSNSGKGGGGAD